VIKIIDIAAVVLMAVLTRQ